MSGQGRKLKEAVKRDRQCRAWEGWVFEDRLSRYPEFSLVID